MPSKKGSIVTDSLVKKKFISDTLREGIHKIYDVQEEVVRKNYKSRTGRLRTLLSAHSYDTEMADGKTTLYVRIWPYMRFLDMAYRLRTDRMLEQVLTITLVLKHNYGAQNEAYMMTEG